MPLLSPEKLSERVLNMLSSSGAKYHLIAHASEGSCVAVSKLRGNNPREAVKAMMVVAKLSSKHSKRLLALLPGDATINFDQLKAQLKARSVSMAAAKEVRELLDSEPGGVSPFSFNDSLEVIIDKELTNANHVFFSAGKTDESVTMPKEDFMRVSLSRGATVLSFSNLPECNYGASTHPAEESHIINGAGKEDCVRITSSSPTNARASFFHSYLALQYKDGDATSLTTTAELKNWLLAEAEANLKLREVENLSKADTDGSCTAYKLV